MEARVRRGRTLGSGAACRRREIGGVDHGEVEQDRGRQWVTAMGAELGLGFVPSRRGGAGGSSSGGESRQQEVAEQRYGVAAPEPADSARGMVAATKSP